MHSKKYKGGTAAFLACRLLKNTLAVVLKVGPLHLDCKSLAQIRVRRKPAATLW